MEDSKTLVHEFLFKANMLNISGHFVGQWTRREVPLGDPLKQANVATGGFLK